MRTVLRTSEAQEIENFLMKHNSFGECIIEKETFSHYGTTFDVHLNYIWDFQGRIRRNLDKAQIIILRFRLVQELHIKNVFTAAMLEAPEHLNWGFAEVALVKVVKNSDRVSANGSSLHMAFLWESDQRVDVIFSELEVIKQ